jgi:hypothetical protein
MSEKPNSGKFYNQVLQELVIPQLGHEPTLAELSLFDMGYHCGACDTYSEKLTEQLEATKQALKSLVSIGA